jgi:tricorn protease-like protein
VTSKLDADTYNTTGRDFDAVWSPDSKWITALSSPARRAASSTPRQSTKPGAPLTSTPVRAGITSCEPLSAPGIKVNTSDYLLEVNGRPITASMTVYQAFEGTAGHQTVLRLNATPSLDGSRIESRWDISRCATASDGHRRRRASSARR